MDAVLTVTAINLTQPKHWFCHVIGDEDVNIFRSTFSNPKDSISNQMDYDGYGDHVLSVAALMKWL